MFNGTILVANGNSVDTWRANFLQKNPVHNLHSTDIF